MNSKHNLPLASSTAMSRPTSGALTFLRAAFAAMPRTVGDRLMSGTLNDFMRAAIECKFIFDRDDGKILSEREFCIRTQVGVFSPLFDGFYHLACRHGGTYAPMWEKHNGFKPWVGERCYDGHVALGRNRVAPGICLRSRGA